MSVQGVDTQEKGADDGYRPMPLAAWRADFDAYCKVLRQPRSERAWEWYVWHRAKAEVERVNIWWAGRAYQRIKTEMMMFGEG